MVFSSIVFLYFFLPLFLICFHLFGRSKNVTLFFSLAFYAWGEPLYILLLLSSIAVNFWLGLKIASQGDMRTRKNWLGVSICINLGVLIVFKYSVFLLQNLAVLLRSPAHSWHYQEPALPLGISFFTFHILSYLVDVYRRDVAPERSLRDLTLYITMFPQLVAGPIVRYKFIATELHEPVVSVQLTATAVRIFVVGLAQKVLIANTLGASVDSIFALPLEQLSTPLAWTGIWLYTLQIYFDFGGYSLMAIGLALMMGFTFPINFNYPYTAQSITDFWRRWHMSLSAWFRDYLYIPLGGNRGSEFQTYRNLIIVFLLCGIWHGASWNFVIWGLIHGLFLIIERAGYSAVLLRLPLLVRSAYTMLVVIFAWVFFRAETLPQAVGFFRAMAGLGPEMVNAPDLSRYLGLDVTMALIAAVLAVGPHGQRALDIISERLKHDWISADALRLAGLVAVFELVTLTLASGVYNPFIYFRF